MAESMMHQAMETWLKKECQSLGMGMLHIGDWLKGIANSLGIPEDEDKIKLWSNNLIHVLSEEELKGHISHEDVRIYLDKLTKIKQAIATSKSDGLEFEDAIEDFMMFCNKHDILTLEKVVECQCGNSS